VQRSAVGGSLGHAALTRRRCVIPGVFRWTGVLGNVVLVSGYISLETSDQSDGTCSVWRMREVAAVISLVCASVFCLRV